MMDSKKVLVFCALVASLGLFGIAGCSSGAASSSASASESSSAASEEVMQVSESAPELQAVGASSNAAATFELTNKTGADITVVSVKAAGAAEYSANMLAANQKIANGETVLFNCPKIEAQSAEQSEQSGDQAEASAQSADVALNDMVDVKIELADGKSYELHQVTVGKVTSATVALSEGLAFLEYKDAQGGSSVSTLESEKAIAKAAEEAAASEQAAQAAPEEQTTQAAPQGEANYQEPVYYDDAAYVDDTAYANTSGNGGGDGAACVDDIVLNF